MNALVPIDSTKHVDSEFIYCEAMLADSMCIEGGSCWILPPKLRNRARKSRVYLA